MQTNLQGKVAVVTGGGGILCSVMAKALAKAGASVAILDLKVESAQKVADEINNNGGKAIAVSANVLDLESLKNAEKQVAETFGSCDILVNGAGGNNPKATTDNEYYNSEDVGKMKTFFEVYINQLLLLCKRLYSNKLEPILGIKKICFRLFLMMKKLLLIPF